MDQLLTGIISNLRRKGLTALEIPRFTKDLYRIIDHRTGLPPNMTRINRELQSLGWLPIADYYLLELMLGLQERREEYRIDQILPHLQLQFADMAKKQYHTV